MNNLGNLKDTTGKVVSRHWLGFLIAGIGLGTALVCLLLRSARSEEIALPAPEKRRDHIVDDRGTGQRAALQMLRNLRDGGFEASDEKLALALGRPVAEVRDWESGQQIIDDDVVMKARGIAILRGVAIE
jgi:hypothetical protein